MTTANGINIKLSHLDSTHASAMPGMADMIIPQVALHLPPSIIVNSFRGLTTRASITACYIDLRSKTPEWIDALITAINHNCQRPANAPTFTFCLAVPNTVEASEYTRLEPEPLTLPTPAEDTGFVRWPTQNKEAGSEEISEESLAKLVLSTQDYAQRWQDNQRRAFYYTRQQEETALKKYLEGHAPCVLVGQALSGKSRLLLHTLSQRKIPLLVAQPDAKQWQFPSGIDQEAWLVFDDIDKMLEQAGFAQKFAHFTSQHSRWLATCRSGDAYELLLAQLSPAAQERLQTLLIGRLSDQEVAAVAVQLYLNNNTQQHTLAPRNIGYYFLQGALNVWRNQFEQLPAAQKTVLRASAAAMRLGAASEELDRIDLAVPRWFANQGLPELLEENQFTPNAEKLAQTAQGKGWWQVDATNNRVRLEPIFVEYIIDPAGSYCSMAFLMDVLNQLASATEHIRHAIFFSGKSITRWAEQAQQAGLQLNQANFTQLEPHLMRLATGTEQTSAIRSIIALWFGADDAVKPNLLTLLPQNTTTSTKFIAVTINQALRHTAQVNSTAVLNLFSHLHISPDEYTFGTLLAKSTAGAEGKQARDTLLQQMQAAGIAANVVTYTTLLEKADSKHERQTLLQQMQAAGIAADVVTYNTLLEKADSKHERQTLWQQMQAAGIAANVVTYNTLIKYAADFAQAEAYYRQMLQAGCKPDSYTMQALVKKSPNFAAAKRLVAECESQGARFNRHVLSAWQRLAQNADQNAELAARETRLPRNF